MSKGAGMPQEGCHLPEAMLDPSARLADFTSTPPQCQIPCMSARVQEGLQTRATFRGLVQEPAQLTGSSLRLLSRSLELPAFG